MNSPIRLPWLAWTVSLFLPLSLFSTSYGQTEIKNEKALRYHGVLKKRPATGYLFDRFYDTWLDTGTLADLEKFLTTEYEKPEHSTGDALLLGFFFSKQGNDTRATQIFEKALQNDSKNSAAWLEKAKISIRSLNFEQALKDLQSTIDSAPDEQTSLEAHKLKGKLLLRTGKNTEAISLWTTLLEQNPDNEELHEDLIELQIEEGALNEAVQTSNDLVAKTKDPYQKLIRKLRTGDIHLRLQQRQPALEIYKESLKILAVEAGSRKRSFHR